jgi:thiol-disulfide isomerase/thioredoxin
MKIFVKVSLFIISLVISLGLAQDKPVWQTLELTNAKTGEVFTLGGFEGKTVYVEPMATWCSNCRKQLSNVNAAKAELTDDNNVIFIALSVEGNLANEKLAAYAEKEGFDLTFAVATPELLKALVEAFDRSIGNPPSTPHFVIKADGSFSELMTGIDSSEEILALVMN